MEGTWELSTPRTGAERPLYLVAALVSLSALLIIFAEGLFGASFGSEPLILLGAVVWLLSFVDVRIGFALMILAAAASPEFTFMGIANLRLEDFLFPAVFTAWLTRTLAERRPLVQTPLKVPLLALMVICFASSLKNIIYSDLPLHSGVLRLGKITEYFLMFFMALNIPRTKRDLTGFIHLLWISAVVVALYGTVQFLHHGASQRVSGPPGETANILGGFLVFHAAVVLGIGCRRKRLRSAAFLLALLMLVPFVYTLSRGTYVAFFVGMVVLYFLTRDKLSAVVLLAALGLLIFTQARDRFATIFAVFSESPPPSWSARVAGWKAFLPAVVNAPILGLGVGRAPLWIDNEYVRQVYELGLAGFVLFLLLLLQAARTARFVSQEASHSTFRGFASGYLAGLAALLVHAVTATSFTTIRTTEPFFIATGLLCAIAARLTPFSAPAGSTRLREAPATSLSG